MTDLFLDKNQFRSEFDPRSNLMGFDINEINLVNHVIKNSEQL